MLTHLSPQRFVNRIADYAGADKWHFKCTQATIIVFHTDKHLYAKGFRDAYDPLKTEYPDIQTYEVITNEDPDIAKAYDITDFPATMFITAQGKVHIVQGYLYPAEVIGDIKKYLLNT